MTNIFKAIRDSFLRILMYIELYFEVSFQQAA